MSDDINSELKNELKKLLSDPVRNKVLMDAIAEINADKGSDVDQEDSKVARSTCVRCHKIFPRTKMWHTTVSEHAGSSWGVSKRANSKSNPTLSYRSYSRKRKEWVCDTCYEPDRREAEIMLTIFNIGLYSVVGLVLLVVFASWVT